MGTKQQVVQAGGELEGALNRKTDDGRFSADDREDFGRLYTLVANRMSEFELRPKYGGSSDRYDTFITSAGEAANTVESCSAASPASIEAAKAAAFDAAELLPPITG